ncbi:hypothetical protein MNQ98_17630 [Paenibacillus sp. N3/727]|uniref:hypothetical protein n=1 Tax=Paenibacillus sp. N3/727 TaxID=2925845 RepID=UPI001F534049|nr:hypothetical protein [Paenibacillus sp. N3/727]UNK16337.1 hypothetical protein MNQ98_17630 [Paenibacillus sp. N3/727]
MKSEVNKLPSKKKTNHKSTTQWLGKPVMVVLKDGSYYIGTMNSIEKDKLTLSGLRPEKKLPASVIESRDKAQISGFLSALLGGFNSPTGAAAEGGSNGLGIFGFLGQIMPHIQVGMNMVKSIMPLMGLLKG